MLLRRVGGSVVMCLVRCPQRAPRLPAGVAGEWWGCAYARSVGQAVARQGRRARCYAESDELVSVFELDRGRAWTPWTMMVGGAVREWLDVDGIPAVAGCHVQSSTR